MTVSDTQARHNCPLCGCQTISHTTDNVLCDIGAERERQEERFPEQTLPHSPVCGTSVGAREPQINLKDARAREARAKEWVRYHLERGQLTWADVLNEEVAEALAATEIEHLREELIQVAAVAVRWVEDIDRQAVQAA